MDLKSDRVAVDFRADYGGHQDFHSPAEFYSVTVLDSLLGYLNDARTAAEPLTRHLKLCIVMK